MELYLLGTGTCSPVKGRWPACYYLSSGPSRLLIDPGPGALNRMVDAGLSPFDIEAILISHHHLDHFAGLMPYLFSYKNCMEDHGEGYVKIIAPTGFSKVFSKLMEVYGQWIFSDDYDIRIEEMSDSVITNPAFSISSKPMQHGANGIGFRVEKGGSSFAYSGDTELCDELIELAMGADTLLVECSYPDHKKVEGHMTPKDVAKVGRLSGVKKIVLTHFYPDTDTEDAAKVIADEGFDGEVIVGEDGMKVTI